MTEYELKQELQSEEKQQDFYEKIRNKIKNYLESRVLSASKFAPYLLFAPELFHLLTK
ncbi:MAG: hypothetical protein ABWY25_05240 [Paenisporosarcina sp.]